LAFAIGCVKHERDKTPRSRAIPRTFFPDRRDMKEDRDVLNGSSAFLFLYFPFFFLSLGSHCREMRDCSCWRHAAQRIVVSMTVIAAVDSNDVRIDE